MTPDASDRVGNRDADVVASRDHGIGRHRLAGIADATPHINDEPVQRTLHVGAVELPVAEGAASVRAAIVDGGTAIVCGAITEDLKMKKFSGDFNLMLAWWRQNKAAEHQALTTAGYAVSGR